MATESCKLMLCWMKARKLADVAAELGLQWCLQKVNVSILNGRVETFETSPVNEEYAGFLNSKG